jgi:hypothetical protein
MEIKEVLDLSQSVIRLLDSPELYTQYRRKKDSAINDLQVSKNLTLIGKNTLAVVYIDICMEIYMEYLGACNELFRVMGKQLQQRNEWYKETVSPMIDSLNSSTSNFVNALEDNSDITLIEFLKSTAESNINGLENFQASNEAITNLDMLTWSMHKIRTL